MLRRQALLGLVAVTGFSGCIGSFDESRATPSKQTTEPPGSPSSRSSEPEPEPQGPVRGENEADISIRVTETDESVEYLPANDSVRFVTHRSGGAPADYAVRDWETWARLQCVIAARDPAVRHATEELGQSVGGAASDEEVYTQITTTLDRDGNVFDRPTVDFDQLVAATPKTVEVTYVLSDREHTCEVPVYARHVVGHLE